MLFLTRKIGEKIFIGPDNDIVVCISQINGNQVVIGIEADKCIPILREEVFLRDFVKNEVIELIEDELIT